MGNTLVGTKQAKYNPLIVYQREVAKVRRSRRLQGLHGYGVGVLKRPEHLPKHAGSIFRQMLLGCYFY